MISLDELYERLGGSAIYSSYPNQSYGQTDSCNKCCRNEVQRQDRNSADEYKNLIVPFTNACRYQDIHPIFPKRAVKPNRNGYRRSNQIKSHPTEAYIPNLSHDEQPVTLNPQQLEAMKRMHPKYDGYGLNIMQNVYEGKHYCNHNYNRSELENLLRTSFNSEHRNKRGVSYGKKGETIVNAIDENNDTRKKNYRGRTKGWDAFEDFLKNGLVNQTSFNPSPYDSNDVLKKNKRMKKKKNQVKWDFGDQERGSRDADDDYYRNKVWLSLDDNNNTITKMINNMKKWDAYGNTKTDNRSGFSIGYFSTTSNGVRKHRKPKSGHRKRNKNGTKPFEIDDFQRNTYDVTRDSMGEIAYLESIQLLIQKYGKIPLPKLMALYKIAQLNHSVINTIEMQALTHYIEKIVPKLQHFDQMQNKPPNYDTKSLYPMPNVRRLSLYVQRPHSKPHHRHRRVRRMLDSVGNITLEDKELTYKNKNRSTKHQSHHKATTTKGK